MKALAWGLGGLAIGFAVGRWSRKSEKPHFVGQGGYVPPPPPRQPGPIVSFTCGPDPRQSLLPHQPWPPNMYDRVYAWMACLWKSKNRDLVSEVQSFLGRNPHSIDGVIDEDLRDKVRGFQSTFHLPITGEVDQVTAKAMDIAARTADEAHQRAQSEHLTGFAPEYQRELHEEPPLWAFAFPYAYAAKMYAQPWFVRRPHPVGSPHPIGLPSTP